MTCPKITMGIRKKSNASIESELRIRNTATTIRTSGHLGVAALTVLADFALIPRLGVSPADFLDLRELQGAFTDLGIYRVRELELSGAGADSESIAVAEVSAAVFPLLGVSAADGRTFLPEEDRAEPSAVVIGDRLRRRRFAGASPIGARLMLDRRPYTIVGVLPAGFEFPPRGPTFNGQPASFRACVQDMGKNGRGREESDRFHLTCTAGCSYTASGTLSTGNLVVKQQ